MRFDRFLDCEDTKSEDLTPPPSPQGTIRFMHIASIQVEHASFPEILTTLDALAGH